MNPEQELQDVTIDIERLTGRYSLLHLWLLCLDVRAEFPDAEAVVVSPSDQPGTMHYWVDYVTPDRDDSGPLAWEFDDDNGHAMCLYGEGWGTDWQKYATLLDAGEDRWLIDIDKVLTTMPDVIR